MRWRVWAPPSPRCCCAGSRVGIAHIGDSRAFLLRGGEFSQITHDHTFVQTLVDEGRISADEAEHHRSGRC